MRSYILKPIIGLVIFFAYSANTNAQTLGSVESLEKIGSLLMNIERYYVDTVDNTKLADDAIRAILEDLDPHSTYIPVEDLAQMNEPLDGNFDGIGIQFNILKDTIIVVSPISGGPSEKLGILAGDKIVEIEDEVVAGIGISNKDVMSKLKGPKGTKVKVGITRRGEKKLLDFTITRDEIPIYSVDATYMATPEIGYIKVNRFAKTTAEEFRSALLELKEKGMKDLILDLQGNGGGYLNIAIEMADELLNADKLIVYTEGRQFPKQEYHSSTTGSFEDGRLVVLIDEGSASASEIVTGAVQDWDRGLVIGRRSFGKGLVQRRINLSDGSEVRLTIQKYYTPSGRCIQKPYEEGVDAYYKEKMERYGNGELLSLDSVPIVDSLKYFTNNNRLVYGGGGIVPDIFVSIDTTQSSEYNSQLIRKGIMNNFALSWTNKNRNNLKKEYANADEFVKNFNVDEELKNELISYAKNEGLEFNEADYEISEDMIEGRLKSYIARDMFNTSAYYQAFNPYWGAYQKAIDVLTNNNYGNYNLAKSEY